MQITQKRFEIEGRKWPMVDRKMTSLMKGQGCDPISLGAVISKMARDRDSITMGHQ